MASIFSRPQCVIPLYDLYGCDILWTGMVWLEHNGWNFLQWEYLYLWLKFHQTLFLKIQIARPKFPLLSGVQLQIAQNALIFLI